jgi:hypothetical protein
MVGSEPSQTNPNSKIAYTPKPSKTQQTDKAPTRGRNAERTTTKHLRNKHNPRMNKEYVA